MNTTRLTCPSCGAELDVPNNLTIAHCIYCGSKVLLDQGSGLQDRKDIDRYSELCKVALKAENFEEVRKYCERLLEVDPRNASGWVYKARVRYADIKKSDVDSYTNMLYETRGRVKEVMSYIEHARSLEPTNEDVIAAFELVVGRQKEVCKFHMLAFQTAIDMATKQQVANSFVDGVAEVAMGLSLDMLDLCPGDEELLANVNRLHNTWSTKNWASWDERVPVQLAALRRLTAQKEAASQLPQVKKDLAKAKESLAKASQQTDLFNKAKAKVLEQKVRGLEKEAARLEKVLAA